MPYLIGEVILFAGPTSIKDFLPCDGRTVTVDAYPALWRQIGHLYGGSGATFALPNLVSPVTGTQYLICVDNGVESPKASFALSGGLWADIHFLAGPPRDMTYCLLADGRKLTRDANSDTFNLLGYRFGGFDRYFGIPNVASLGAGPGVPAYFLNAGIFPSRYYGHADAMFAQIQLTALDYIEPSFLDCDGSILRVSGATGGLFSQIGYKFGGQGYSFALPTLPSKDGVSPRICYQGMFPTRIESR